MKKLHHIIILIAAIAVFFTGTGVTVMNYCCSGCISEFFSEQEQTCCCSSTSHNSMAMGDDGCCSDNHKKEMAQHNDCTNSASSSQDHCSSSRISIDLDSSIFKPHLAILFTWLSDIPVFTLNILPHVVEYTHVETYTGDPPSILPRSYLSLIRVLII